jgi:hypothetical protein
MAHNDDRGMASRILTRPTYSRSNPADRNSREPNSNPSESGSNPSFSAAALFRR